MKKRLAKSEKTGSTKNTKNMNKIVTPTSKSSNTQNKIKVKDVEQRERTDKDCSVPSVVYLDNNATTLICSPAKKAFTDWLSCYNASSDSKIAKPSKKIIEDSTDYILSHCNTSTANHTVIFTSGGTESNCYIIKACVKAFKKKLNERGSNLKPHVILSAMEHHSSLECAKELEESGEADISYVMPTIYGNILPEDIEAEIKTNTCLVSIMYANNEVPIINNISAIGEIAHKNRIPMHSDCVQIFGKYKIDLDKNNVDCISASAHKFYGPKGVGLLIISKALIDGYGLTAEINGSQQYGLRGGTENVPGIASLVAALKWCFVKRKEKNAKLLKMRNYTLDKLSKSLPFNEFINYAYDEIEKTSESKERKIVELVSLGPPADKPAFLLPNTILLAICKNKGKPFCNVELKKFLDSKGIVISIGSACLTSSDKASHVLNAIGAPPVIKRGVIRISFGDNTTQQEVDKAIVALLAGIKKQCSDLENSDDE